jgi:hypothetical protein
MNPDPNTVPDPFVSRQGSADPGTDPHPFTRYIDPHIRVRTQIHIKSGIPVV